jgi:hypothetical protein
VPRNTSGLRRGGGRPKGVPNKIGVALKEMILGALDEAGGKTYLVKQSSENPAAFMTLVGKVLPTTLTDGDGRPLFPVGGIVINVPKLDGADNRT